MASVRVEIVFYNGKDLFDEDGLPFPQADAEGYAEVHNLLNEYGYKGKIIGPVRSIRIEQDEIRAEVELREDVQYE